MLLDIKSLTANIEEGQARLIDRLDQTVELLEPILIAGQGEEHAHIADERQPA